MPNDDLSDYQITPDDLGCGPEPENPPGLVEETIGETKTPAPKSFKNIPFAVKQRARELYDQFEKKDMSFVDFCVELYALQSPALMQADLQDIITEKEDGHRMQAANMHSMKRNMN